jgi:hypothetical protein
MDSLMRWAAKLDNETSMTLVHLLSSLQAARLIYHCMYTFESNTWCHQAVKMIWSVRLFPNSGDTARIYVAYLYNSKVHTVNTLEGPCFFAEKARSWFGASFRIGLLILLIFPRGGSGQAID